MAAFDDTSGVANMVLLDNCDDEKLIDNLRMRLQKDIIYTYIGDVLISVNPYKTLSIYNDKLMLHYYNNNDYAEKMPHIFATSAKAFKSLKEYRREQCILISGESGSGKTEASKRVLQFISEATHGYHEIQMIRDKLLVANSVLEAFGNAKTRNNDNSSRYGKYMDVQFNHMCQPMGGNILNYLLEKSRVVKQAHNERNYHIFYQLINGADKWLVQLLEIDQNTDYLYLRTDRNDNVNLDMKTDFNVDSDKYKETLQTLQVLEFDLDEIMDILKIIASILHVGNVRFYENNDVCEIENIYTIRLVADLLGIPWNDLMFSLTNKTIRAHGEVIRMRLDVEMSIFARDALAKAIYSRLFEWLVTHINKTLRTTDCKNYGRINKSVSFGILDIYGFEILQNNGFEQFCINYCNEKLQKLFLDMTLKSEQQEYLNEGIEWTVIDYFDNGIICDMIDERHIGILSCLDDEYFKQTDVCNNLGLVNELARRFKEHKHFSCYQSTDMQTKSKSISTTEFKIVHFAGPVTYDTSSFLEKNNDSLSNSVSQIMSNSTNKIIKSCFSDSMTLNKKLPETTIKQFKTNLDQLIKTLSSKQPSYIRCIKPNNYKNPGEFDKEMVRNQVKSMGLMETLRIRKAGFAYRGKFEEFLDRYKSLCPDTWPDWTRYYETGVDAVVRLIKHLGYTDEDFKIGKTKIMIKHPRTVFEIEDRLVTKHALATKIQSAWRGYVARQRYVRLVKSEQTRRVEDNEMIMKRIVFVQANVRRMLAVRAYRRTRAAVQTIKNFFKRLEQRRFFIRLSVTLPQSLLDDYWPEPSARCAEVSAHLKIMHRTWLSRRYRLDLVKHPKLYEQLKFKLAASEIFKGRKSVYPESVKIEFNENRDGNLQFLKIAYEIDTNPNTTYLYATKVTKFDRRGYKHRERILAVTTETVSIFEKTDKYLKIKDCMLFKYITGLQMTTGLDNFLLIKVSGQLEKSKGDILLEIPYLVECVTVISKQVPAEIIDFVNMQTCSCMKHDIRNSKTPGIIEFIPVSVLKQKGDIYKGKNGNLMITG